MKKLLLSVILFASAAAKADVVLETTFKEGDKEMAAQAVVLSESVNQALYTLNEISFKVVVTKMIKNEDGVLEFAFDFFKVVDDVETLIAQPEFQFNDSLATLTLGDDYNSFTFAVNEVEAQENIEENN